METKTSRKAEPLMEDESNRLADSNETKAVKNRKSAKTVLLEPPAVYADLGDSESSVDIFLRNWGKISGDEEPESHNLHNFPVAGTELLGRSLGLNGTWNYFSAGPQAGASLVEELVCKNDLDITKVSTELSERVSNQCTTKEDLHSVAPGCNKDMQLLVRNLSKKFCWRISIMRLEATSGTKISKSGCGIDDVCCQGSLTRRI